MSGRDNVSQLQDESATGQDWAHQGQWYWENVSKKGKGVTGQKQWQPEKRVVRTCERSNSADTRVSGDWGGGGAPGVGADFPAACGEDCGEIGCTPAAHRAHNGAEIHLQTLEDPTLVQMDALRRLRLCEQPVLDQAPGRTCWPMQRGHHAGSSFAGKTFPWDTRQMQSLPEELYPMEETHAGAA